MADKTQKYVVTHGGMTDKKGKDIEIGTPLDLTEKQAKSRIGKVALASDAKGGKAANSASDKKAAGLEKANALLKEQVDALTVEKVDLEKQVADLTAKAK